MALGILRAAAGHIADAAAAVCPPGADRAVACTGGLFGIGAPLLDPLRTALGERLPDARLAAAAGSPLDGALTIAAALVSDRLLLPAEAGLLQITRPAPG